MEHQAEPADKPCTPSGALFSNISSTFSGVGYAILDVNSVVHCAVRNYQLDLHSLPTFLISSHLRYLVDNLHAASLSDLQLYSEPSSNPHIAAILAMLDSLFGPFRSYCDIEKALSNDRVAFVLLSKERKKLNKFMHMHGVYTAMIDTLIFLLPYAYCNVEQPGLKLKEEEYEVEQGWKGKGGEREIEEILEEYGTTIEKQKKEYEEEGKEYEYGEGGIQVEEEMLGAIVRREGRGCLIDGYVLGNARREVQAEHHSPEPCKAWDTPPFPWSKKDVELNMSGEVGRFNPRHMANISRSAMSLYNGLYRERLQAPRTTREQAGTKKQSAASRRIIEQNRARLEKEKAREENAWLMNFHRQYEKLGSIQSRKAFLEGMRTESAYIRGKVMLLRAELYMERWNVEKHSENVDESVLVPLYLVCLEYIEEYAEQAGASSELQSGAHNVLQSDAHNVLQFGTPEELEFIVSLLGEAGFEASARELLHRHKLSGAPEEPPAPNELDLYFQLKYAGEHLRRTLGTRKDSRVPFDPDRWQAELLDAVDADSSALVSAPTSSGKTFICFYAIERVLRSSDTDMVVFCLPTKALVNQVTADIYARFTQKSCATVLQGTLMPDHSNETFNCQVLITVPSMLESLLASGLAPQIRYIIIDEVHKIDDYELGVPIERVIHLARAPLLLLSATISNLDSFFNWFRAVETSKGRACQLVTHDERFCELKMHLFGKSNRLVPLNGMFGYSYSHLRAFGFGESIHFLPEELLNLYYFAYMVLAPDQKGLARELAPSQFFNTNIITKQDVRAYEKYLLRVLERWIREDVLDEEQTRQIYEMLVGEGTEEAVDESGEAYIVAHIMELLEELRTADMLPVILFNTDRDLVTRIALRVYTALEARDVARRKDRAVERMLKEAKRKRDSEKSRDAWIDESVAAEQAPEPDVRDPRHTFLDPATRLTDAELDNEFASFRDSANRDIIGMAYRGIGIHHSAMGRKYRSAVEILFRKKHVRILFATDTLALGVNMPCRTVVFMGDSLRLDPTNYRQMAGRAGRRGFDTLGHVVFMGIPRSRMQNLMVSRMPEIRGGYAMCNSSFVSFDLADAVVARPLLAESYGRAKNTADGTSNSSNANMVSLFKEKLSLQADSSMSSSGMPASSMVDTPKLAPPSLSPYLFTPFIQDRPALLRYQQTRFPFIFTQSYLWDLYVSNRSADPGIFIFALLVAHNALSWREDELALVVAHLFEVRPFVSDPLTTLKPLPVHISNIIRRVNSDYVLDLLHFYSPQLRTLARRSPLPLHYVNSFIYTLDVPKNSFIYDFFQHGTARLIQSRNGVPIGELWQSLRNIERLLRISIQMMERGFPDNPSINRLKEAYKRFNMKFKAMYA